MTFGTMTLNIQSTCFWFFNAIIQVSHILHSQSTSTHHFRHLLMQNNRPHYGSSPPPTSHDLKCKTSRSPICDLWRWRKRAPLLLLLLAPPTTHYCTFQLAAAVIIIFGLMCSGCNNITMGFGGVFIWVKTQIQLVRSKPISVQAIFVFLCVLLYFCVFLLYFCVFLLYFLVFLWMKTSPGGEE